MAVPAGAFRTAKHDNSPAVDAVPIDVSGGDQDLTLGTGLTGGWCARSFYVTVAGDVAFYAVGANTAPSNATPVTPTIRTMTVPAKTVIPVQVAQFNTSGTTATGIVALL